MKISQIELPEISTIITEIKKSTDTLNRLDTSKERIK